MDAPAAAVLARASRVPTAAGAALAEQRRLQAERAAGRKRARKENHEEEEEEEQKEQGDTGEQRAAGDAEEYSQEFLRSLSLGGEPAAPPPPPAQATSEQLLAAILKLTQQVETMAARQALTEQHLEQWKRAERSRQAAQGQAGALLPSAIPAIALHAAGSGSPSPPGSPLAPTRAGVVSAGVSRAAGSALAASEAGDFAAVLRQLEQAEQQQRTQLQPQVSNNNGDTGTQSKRVPPICEHPYGTGAVPKFFYPPSLVSEPSLTQALVALAGGPRVAPDGAARQTRWKTQQEGESHLKRLADANSEAQQFLWAMRWVHLHRELTDEAKLHGWEFARDYLFAWFDYQLRNGLDFLALEWLQPSVEREVRLSRAVEPVGHLRQRSRNSRNNSNNNHNRTPHPNPCKLHGPNAQHSDADCYVQQMRMPRGNSAAPAAQAQRP